MVKIALTHIAQLPSVDIGKIGLISLYLCLSCCLL